MKFTIDEMNILKQALSILEDKVISVGDDLLDYSELDEWLHIDYTNYYSGRYYWYVAGKCPYSHNTLYDSITFNTYEEARKHAQNYYLWYKQGLINEN